MNCNPPDSSVQGISQERILGWVAISFSRGFNIYVGSHLHQYLYWQYQTVSRCQFNPLWLWFTVLSLLLGSLLLQGQQHSWSISYSRLEPMEDLLVQLIGSCRLFSAVTRGVWDAQNFWFSCCWFCMTSASWTGLWKGASIPQISLLRPCGHLLTLWITCIIAFSCCAACSCLWDSVWP